MLPPHASRDAVLFGGPVPSHVQGQTWLLCFLALGLVLFFATALFFLPVNPDVRVTKFMVLIEGQVPFLALSVTEMLLLIGDGVETD